MATNRTAKNRRANVDQLDKRDRAAQAVRAFNRMIPGLTAYVRAMTGDHKLQVRANTFTATDGTVINIRPPMILAETADHDRLLCDKREGYRLLCPACHKTEAVWAALYHEMSHITSGSLAKHTGATFTRAVAPVLDTWPERYQTAPKEALAKVNGRAKIDAYLFATDLHPHLLNFLRATDDWMIESRAFVARAGVESMLYHQSQQLLERGLETSDNSQPSQTWGKQPVEVQLPVAVLMELHGWELDSFSHEAVELVRSPGIADIINRWSGKGDTATIVDALVVAAELLGEFNRLGLYCVEPPEQRDDNADTGADDDDPSAQASDNGQPQDSGEQTGPSTGESGDAEGDTTQGDNHDVPSPDDRNGARADQTGPSDNQSDPAEPSSDIQPEPDDQPVSDTTSNEGGSDSGDDFEPHDGPADSEPDTGSGDPSTDMDADTDTADSDSNDGGVDDTTGEASEDNGNSNGESERDETDDSDGDTDTGTTESDEPEFIPADSTDNSDIAPVAPETIPVDKKPESRETPTPEQIKAALDQMTGHEAVEEIMNTGHADPDKSTAQPDTVGVNILENAINQAMNFDAPSRAVGKLNVYSGRDAYFGTGTRGYGELDYRPIEESELAPTIHRARRVFTDNSLDKHMNNLKKGKLSARNLGARGWGDDERLFRKKIRANKTDYEVVIGMDISGSTQSRQRNHLIKSAGYGMAEILNRINVPFSMYAHTTSRMSWDSGSLDQEVYQIKDQTTPWSAKTRELLSKLTASQGSLDGHNFEFYRKVLMKSRAEKKICIYFTDGAIPETNHTEERAIMIREAGMYKRLGIESLIVAVDIRLEDAYGFDQVNLARTSDMSAVLKALEKKLTGGA